jgi:hypothetical protein
MLYLVGTFLILFVGEAGILSTLLVIPISILLAYP